MGLVQLLPNGVSATRAVPARVTALPIRSRRRDEPIDPRILVVQAAELAPSIHNSQPWLFIARPDGSLDVRIDRTRHLRAIDASGRQMLVSCGAAVEFARLAYRALGHAVTVDVLPDPLDPGHVARITAEPGDEPTADDLAIVAAMALRHTDRGPYDDTPVPAELLDELRTGLAARDVWLRQIDMAVDRVVVGAALCDGENRLADDPAYVAELARWTSADLRRREGVVPPEPWPADRVSDMPLRDFTGRPGHGRQPHLAAPAVERDTIILLGTSDDDARAHVQTGRALAWAWLRLTVSGVSAQPLGQSFDDAVGRRRLAHDLRLVGHPQFLFRLGYGHGRGGARRRPLDDVLAVQYAPGDRSGDR